MKNRYLTKCRVTPALVRDAITDFLSKTAVGGYTTGYCVRCKADQVIFCHGTTPCPVCGDVLYPCHGDCPDCDFTGCEFCPYGCPSNEATRAKVASNRAATIWECRILETWWRLQARLQRLWFNISGVYKKKIFHYEDSEWFFLDDDTELPF